MHCGSPVWHILKWVSFMRVRIVCHGVVHFHKFDETPNTKLNSFLFFFFYFFSGLTMLHMGMCVFDRSGLSGGHWAFMSKDFPLGSLSKFMPSNLTNLKRTPMLCRCFCVAPKGDPDCLKTAGPLGQAQAPAQGRSSVCWTGVFCAFLGPLLSQNGPSLGKPFCWL